MINLLAKRAIDRGFDPRSGHTKELNMCICGDSAYARSIAELEEIMVGIRNMCTSGVLCLYAE